MQQNSRLLSLLFFLLTQTLLAQTSLPNGSFEDWTTTTYTNPNGWQTLNILSSLGAPVVATQSPDAQLGNSALRVETVSFFGNKIPGLCYLGEFDATNPLNGTKFGKPFTGQPTYFMGYYKYQPNGIDTGGISLQLWHFDPATNRRDTIAEAILTTLESNNAYTFFKIPLTYTQNIAPDSISLVIVSSSSAAPIIGQVGTALYIDELSLSYETLGNDPVVAPLAAQVGTHNDVLTIDLSYTNQQQTTHYELINGSGQVAEKGVLPSQTQYHIAIRHLPSGVYLCRLYNNLQQESTYKLWIK